MIKVGQNFQADLRIGLQAEMAYFNYLESKGKFVLHVTGHWKWWDIIEFGPKVITYEVKNDSWAKDTGNLCIELWSHKQLQHPGWVKYSKATYLIYFISPTEYLKIPMQKIRDYVNSDKINNKRKVAGWSKGNPWVENVLIPYTEFTRKIWRTDDAKTN